MKLKKYEVIDVKWMAWEEIDNLVNERNFMNYRWEFVKDLLNKEIKHLQ